MMKLHELFSGLGGVKILNTHPRYEIPATELRAFPGTRYPDMVFAYTRFNLEAMRLMSPSEIERLKVAEAVRFNGSGSRPYDLDLPGIANISESVYRYAVGGKALL